jgi:hypothetical protein
MWYIFPRFGMLYQEKSGKHGEESCGGWFASWFLRRLLDQGDQICRISWAIFLKSTREFD